MEASHAAQNTPLQALTPVAAARPDTPPAIHAAAEVSVECDSLAASVRNTPDEYLCRQIARLLTTYPLGAIHDATWETDRVLTTARLAAQRQAGSDARKSA